MQVLQGNRAMQEGMRRLSSGVCVISSIDGSGQPFAMTATSVTSVSDSPASLLVCVNRSAGVHRAIHESGRFCVNLLLRGQEAISNLCSGGEEGIRRFSLGDWRNLDQLPYLEDGLAVFTCRNDRLIDYGTHGIFIGLIEAVSIREGEQIEPLVYLNGSYGSFG